SIITKKFSPTRFLNRKPAPELVDDVLEQIFWILSEPSEDDGVPGLQAYTNLFRCMLVNKSWCASAVTMLHRHPWRLHRLYTLRTTDLAYDRCQLVKLYLTMLDRDERKPLLEKGIELPEPNHNPMFNYPAFVKYLDYGVMVSSVWTIYSTSCYTYDQNEWVSLVVRALLRLFAYHTRRLQWLRCAPMSFSFDEMYYS
ncbi:8319_t:CDS:1, partial [Ambispora leptoticha]